MNSNPRRTIPPASRITSLAPTWSVSFTTGGGPTDVQVSRQERDNGVMLRLSHDGYADRFGVVHQRSLRLSTDGRRLDGEDVFVPAHGESLPARRGDSFAVRFHLHPGIKANRHSDGHRVLLVLPNRDVWTFDAYEERVELDTVGWDITPPADAYAPVADFCFLLVRTGTDADRDETGLPRSQRLKANPSASGTVSRRSRSSTPARRR